jgi:hypothetical protein
LRQNLFKGAAAEYRAAAYYLDRGEVVYWPALPLESDFVVERSGGKLEKIQVKYTSWSKVKGHSKNYEHLHCRTYGWNGGRTKTPGPPQYDYLFVISEDDRMWEIPAHILPKHAIGLDSRGGAFRHKGVNVRKWDDYLVSPINDQKEQA